MKKSVFFIVFFIGSLFVIGSIQSVFYNYSYNYEFNLFSIFFYGFFVFSIVTCAIKANKEKTLKKDIRNEENHDKPNDVKEESFDPLDSELDALSLHLRENCRSYNGVIKNKYSSFNKKGDLTFILIIKDLEKFDEFEEVVSNDFFNNHYIGQKVRIERGFKRKIKDIE